MRQAVADHAGGEHHPIYLLTDFEGMPRRAEPDKHAALEWFPLNRPPGNVAMPTRIALATWNVALCRKIGDEGHLVVCKQ